MAHTATPARPLMIHRYQVCMPDRKKVHCCHLTDGAIVEYLYPVYPDPELTATPRGSHRNRCRLGIVYMENEEVKY
jgi:hypothetical protein